MDGSATSRLVRSSTVSTNSSSPSRESGPPVRPREVGEQPGLAVGIEEREVVLGLVALDPRDEPEPLVQRLDQHAIGLRDLLAEPGELVAGGVVHALDRSRGVGAAASAPCTSDVRTTQQKTGRAGRAAAVEAAL
jgi:hypothetical protein